MKNLDRLRQKIIFFCVLCVLSGCSTINVNTYSSNKPLMVPEKFFDGPMTAHGVVKDRSGKVIRYFNANIQGSFDGKVITLDEDFIFNDGEKQKRVWKIVKNPDGTYTGTAGDVVGEAQGSIAGNSMFLKYVLDVPYKPGKTIHITIDDRMYLVESNILINESKMKKFGLKVGEILLVIKKD